MQTNANILQDSMQFFALAQLSFNLKDYTKAKEYYQKRITLGGSEEEIYFSLFQLGVIAIKLNEPEENILNAFMDCCKYRPSRAEALYQLAVYYRTKKKYEQGYLCAKEASKIPYPGEAATFVSKEVYEYQIADELQICALGLGKYEESYELCQTLLDNPAVPQSKLARIYEDSKNDEEKLNQKNISEQNNPPSQSNNPNKQGALVEVIRLMAWGDILMGTCVFPGLKAQGYRIRFICLSKYRDLLEDNPYVDELVTVGGTKWEETWKYIEHAVADLEKPIKRIILDYPALPAEHPTTMFCKQMGIPVSDELSVALLPYHHEWAQQFKNSVLIHTTTRGSFYKNWPLFRWAHLAEMLRNNFNIEIYQIGDHGDQPVEGVEIIRTPSIRHSIAAIQHCRLFIGLDSVLNHATRAVKKPSIILWGPTDPGTSGYNQNINIVNGMVWTTEMNRNQMLHCQPCWRFPQERFKPEGEELLCPNLVIYPKEIKILHCRSTEKEPIELFHPENNLINSWMNSNTIEAVYYQAEKMLIQSKNKSQENELKEIKHA